MNSKMWYCKPASEWKEGLPIGNGMLAGMVMGTFPTERLALNHEWLWRANGRYRTTPPKHHHLQKIRELFFQGKTLEAGELANERLGGLGGVSGQPNRVDPYQPAGDLFLETDHQQLSEYQRELDLETGIVSVRYKIEDVEYQRQFFAHASLPVFCIRIHCSQPGRLNLRARLSRIEDPDCQLISESASQKFGLYGEFPEGVRFFLLSRVISHDGNVVAETDTSAVKIEDATEAVLLLTIAVTHDGEDPRTLAHHHLFPSLNPHPPQSPLQGGKSPRLPSSQEGPGEVRGRSEGGGGTYCDENIELDDVLESWEALQESHLEAYRSLYGSVSLDLGDSHDERPTDERLAALRAGKEDNGLMALYFNFGRYLLLSSSRPGGLPANLQGKWNEELHPPWECDLHHDVNLQMNYWSAEVCGLSECAEPLFDHIDRFVPHGREMAKALYNCEGMWLPIQTDPWGRATPESRGWDVWTGAAAWLAQHLWWRYEYSLDKEFLHERAYPIFKEVAAFYQSYLVRDPQNRLAPVPSQSPENTFKGGTRPVSLCIAATMDLELIYDVLTHAIRASEILGVDAELRETWRKILDEIPPLQIGRFGQLQEWLEDYEEAEPGHRHISHLFALFPGDQLTLEDTPKLTQAARVSLERRLASGGGHTGWSRAWTLCCWARLREGDLAYEHLRALIADFATDTLLDLHPPRIFQIDGNLGGTAGIAEMLMQSHHGLIRILPALPSHWQTGQVQGLRARGGFIVDIEWQDGKARKVTIHSMLGEECRVLVDERSMWCKLSSLQSSDGETISILRPVPHCLAFQTKAGKSYSLSW